ncbi:hypothetical protein F443_22330, partial [Phytophthora nicotianae P1569]
TWHSQVRTDNVGNADTNNWSIVDGCSSGCCNTTERVSCYTDGNGRDFCTTCTYGGDCHNTEATCSCICNRYTDVSNRGAWPASVSDCCHTGDATRTATVVIAATPARTTVSAATLATAREAHDRQVGATAATRAAVSAAGRAASGVTAAPRAQATATATSQTATGAATAAATAPHGRRA